MCTSEHLTTRNVWAACGFIVLCATLILLSTTDDGFLRVLEIKSLRENHQDNVHPLSDHIPDDEILDGDVGDGEDIIYEDDAGDPDNLKSSKNDSGSAHPNLVLRKDVWSKGEDLGNSTKPMLHLVTFATPSYVKFANALFQSAQDKSSCIFNRTMYSMDDIDREFYTKNKRIFNVRHGAGFWLWKPYIVRKKLGEMRDGDVLMYIDSKYLFMTDPCGLFPDETNQEYTCFNRKSGEGQYREPPWTKRDAYVLMGMQPDFQYIQAWAGFFIMRKTNETVQFVDEWLRYCQDYRIISNAPSLLGREVVGFRANRNDQTVLSLLFRKNEWKCKDLRQGVLFNVRRNRSR